MLNMGGPADPYGPPPTYTGGPEKGWLLTDIAATRNRCEIFYEDSDRYRGGPGDPGQPWELTGITGQFCAGHYDADNVGYEGANFIGRCWIPVDTTHTTSNDEYNSGSTTLATGGQPGNMSGTADQDDELTSGMTTLAGNAATREAKKPVMLTEQEMSPERLNVIQALKQFMAAKAATITAPR